MHSFARHMLLLMMEQRACSGSPSRDKQLSNVALPEHLVVTKTCPTLRSDFGIFSRDLPRYRPTRDEPRPVSRSGPFPRSVTCGPLERESWRSALCCESTCERRARRVTFWHRDANAISQWNFSHWTGVPLVKIAPFHGVGLTVNESLSRTRPVKNMCMWVFKYVKEICYDIL